MAEGGQLLNNQQANLIDDLLQFNEIKITILIWPSSVQHATKRNKPEELKTTEKDYVEQAFKMTCKIHQKLPIGGILVFSEMFSEWRRKV